MQAVTLTAVESFLITFTVSVEKGRDLYFSNAIYSVTQCMDLGFPFLSSVQSVI